MGHLQTNKVRSLLGEVVLLHSLDRMGLALEIEKEAEKKNLSVEALLQVNTTGEPTKSGFSPEEVEGALEKLIALPRIRIRGLMTMGPTPLDVIQSNSAESPLMPCLPVGRGALSRMDTRPAPTNENETRICFRCLRTLRDRLNSKFPDLSLKELSMGMSSDFEIAIEEGATLVRIGTAVFGGKTP